MIKTVIALAVAAGFASAAFAQGPGPAPSSTSSAPATKVVAPAPAAADKKIEAPKAVEPAKAETAKPTPAAASESGKTEVKDEKQEHPAKPKKHARKAVKTDTTAAAKTEAPVPATK